MNILWLRHAKSGLALLVVTLAVLIGAPAAPAQTIGTVAGNGTAGYNGEAQLATSASLSQPKGIAFDARGNIYVADQGNHRVRRISVNGSIATIAGTGTAGYSGDGGLAVQAMLNQPMSVAVDASGNVIITDSQNRRIRRIEATTGIITTIAGTGVEGYSGDGGLATSARIQRAVDVTVDASGNIYFADSVGHRVRRISASGTIITIAGIGTPGFDGDGGVGTSASLNTPLAVALDASATFLYIADPGNHRVRRVRLSDNIITTFAGNGVGGGTDTGSFSGDGGLAILAGLNTPEGVAVDAAGEVYIADMANYRIRRVNASNGLITTFAGTGGVGFSGDGGAAASAQFNLPWSVAVNASGNVYVGEFTNNRVRKILINAESVTYGVAHVAFGGGWQSTLTYTNYALTPVTCQTTFFSDSGGSFLVPFPTGPVITRTDVIGAGGTLHAESNAAVSDPLVAGWAQAQCTGPVKASILFRLYSNGVAAGEAGMNGMAAPSTKFVTYAQAQTGVAYANPGLVPANVTFTAFNTAGAILASSTVTLPARGRGSRLLGDLLGLPSFTGSVQIVSSVPIFSLSVSTESAPLFSALPPGDLDDATILASGSSTPETLPPVMTNTYLFSQLVINAGWQTTVNYINYTPNAVTCETSFFASSGAPLAMPFPGSAAASVRTDSIPGGGTLHIETNSVGGTLTVGWAQARCSGPIKASVLDRLPGSSEATFNGMLAGATRFVTFAQTQTGVAYANPSASQSAQVTVTALGSNGARLGSGTFTLGPRAHTASYVAQLLGLGSFSGSIQITSDLPIMSVSINGEAPPAMSTLPPGELDGWIPLPPGF
jgi:sugar lactone lactonase YvrE